jgi:hypothetical protein
MFTLRSSLVAAAVTAATLVPSAVAQGAPLTLSTELAPTRVAAWEGTVMWSKLDPATGNYELVKSSDGGAPAAVPVPERVGGPFDIDLGTNRSGSTFAVYTRGGDIYRLDTSTGIEGRVDKLSSPTIAERDPTILNGDIAFIRRDGGYDQLRIGNTYGGSQGSRLIVKQRSILSAELGGRHVAYVEQVPSAFREVQVHIRNLSTGRDARVYRAKSGGANAADVTRPSFVASPEAFVWARTNLGSGTGNRFVRYTLHGSKLAYAQGSPFYNSASWAGETLGAATASSLDNGETQGACSDAGHNYCVVEVTGPLSFTLRP